MTLRYALLGLAPARAPWFRELARWSTNGAIGCEFVKCVSVEELTVRLGSGRPWSALLVDGTVTGVDRDLVDGALAGGCTVIGVGPRDWRTLGVSVVLAPAFSPDELQAVVADHARPVGPAALAPDDRDPPGVRGLVVAVCGPGGTGTSTVAMAAAQGLAGDRTGVLLADLARHAQQALLHDVRGLGPGLPELVEAFRATDASPEVVRSLAAHVPDRGYDLLLGLRRASDWTALRPRALAAAVDAMATAYAVVVADIDADLEGRKESGSADVEDRNAAARLTVANADVVLAVGAAGAAGLHALVRVVRDVIAHGLDPARVVPVVNRVRARRGQRGEVAHAVRALVGSVASTAQPVVVGEHAVEKAVRDAVPLPAALVSAVTGAVRQVATRVGAADGRSTTPEPVLVRPGSLGAWYDDEGG